MFKTEFLSKNWLEASENLEESNIVLVGVPYDGTCSFVPGSRFAPEQIRLYSKNLEDYSPYQNRSLCDLKFYDAGDIDLPFGNRDKALGLIKTCVEEVLLNNKIYLGVGGEHLITLPAIEAYYKKYPDLKVIHFDAHTDLRDEYLGEDLSHATVIKRVADIVGMDSILQVGLRSGTKEEFALVNNYDTLANGVMDFEQKLKKFVKCPIFITIDLDVLDPSIMPGTGTQEAGGLFYNEFLQYLLKVKDFNIVGADVVELVPHLDSTGASTACASKIIRELLLLF